MQVALHCKIQGRQLKSPHLYAAYMMPLTAACQTCADIAFHQISEMVLGP